MWTFLTSCIEIYSSKTSSYFITMSSTTGLATDIVPDTIISRTVILIVMVIGALYLPASLAELIDLASRKSKYIHRYRLKKNQNHVVVMGNMDHIILADFLREFFCLVSTFSANLLIGKDHGTETMTTVVVILGPCEPSPEIVNILSDPQYIRRVQYVRGQETSFHALDKVVYSKAQGCFILSRKLNDIGRDARIIDAELLFRAICLRKYAPKVPLYVSMTLPTNRKHFEYLADQTLCLEELKMGMLAQNCSSPGFSTIVIHLVISITEEGIKKHLDRKKSSWAAGYAHSVSQEIYPVSLELFKGQWVSFLKSGSLISTVYRCRYQYILAASSLADCAAQYRRKSACESDAVQVGRDRGRLHHYSGC